MRFSILFFLAITIINNAKAQSYTSYFTGDTANAQTQPVFGVCMMGGATEQDDAMKRFLQNANGGDIVVLRASGSDGYNNYLYSELGISVNSVETIKLLNEDAGSDAYILKQVANCEALWFAGGDQYRYIEFIKDKPLEDTINYLINTKKITVGGTSAGMAILGGTYFPAKNGTLYSKEALKNPYLDRVFIGHNDFLDIPYLKNTITDTHYDREDPDGSKTRKGRHVTFMARMAKDLDVKPYGIACEEYTAVFVDSAGIAKVYGNENYDDNAYFLKIEHDTTRLPETCEDGTPLTWKRGKKALKVYKVKGTKQGTGYVDLKNWETADGGSWMNWYVIIGALFETEATTAVNTNKETQIKVYPNPAKESLTVDLTETNAKKMELVDVLGREVYSNYDLGKQVYVINDLEDYKNQLLFLRVIGEGDFFNFTVRVN